VWLINSIRAHRSHYEQYVKPNWTASIGFKSQSTVEVRN